METASQASQADSSNFISSKTRENVADSSSKDKKILPGRRQQRHSTEIGSEYHRWWVVRNALGFETNEHIAGLLLDGFHSLLQQLVVMCGGETYQHQAQQHTELKSMSESSDSFEEATQSPSPTSSTSPPGVVEDMEEFLEYRNAINHYCDSLLRICGQQDSKLHVLDKASPPVQEFLMRLMGYLRNAKGRNYSLIQKKKRFKPVVVPGKKIEEIQASGSGVPLLRPSPVYAVAENQVATSVHTPVLALVSAQDSVGLLTGAPTPPHLDNSLSNDSTTFSIESIQELPQPDQSAETASASVEEPKRISLFQGPIIASGEHRNIIEKPVFSKSADMEIMDSSQTAEQQLGDIAPNNKVGNTGNSLPSRQLTPLFPSESQNEELKTASYQVTPLVPHYQQQQHDRLKFLQELPKHYTSHQQPLPLNQQIQTSDSGQQNSTQPQTQTVFLDRLQDHHVQDHRQLSEPQCQNSKVIQQLQWGTNLQPSYTSPRTASSPDSSWPLEDHKTFECTREATVQPRYTRASGSTNVVQSFNGSISSSADAKRFSLTENFTYQILPGAVSDLISHNRTDASTMLPAYSVHIPDTSNLSRFPEQTLPGTTPTTSLERKVEGIQTSISVLSSVTGLATCGISFNKLQTSPLAQFSVLKQKPEDINQGVIYRSSSKDVKYGQNNLPETKIPNNAPGQRIASRDSLPLIQPALPPNLDRSTPLPTPLGTPFIFYPANSFTANDNSLASLSSLVQNIVYNSHGTILKPLSLTPVAAVPSTTNLSTSLPIASNQSLSATLGSCQRKPIAAALPVLSSQLSAGKPTLVPFYFTHTALGNLSQIPKSTNSTAGLNPSLSLSGIPPISPRCLPQHKQLKVTSTKASSSKTSNVCSTTTFVDVSSYLNQLKITDVRSCSDSDFTGLGEGTEEAVARSIESRNATLASTWNTGNLKPSLTKGRRQSENYSTLLTSSLSMNFKHDSVSCGFDNESRNPSLTQVSCGFDNESRNPSLTQVSCGFDNESRNPSLTQVSCDSELRLMGIDGSFQPTDSGRYGLSTAPSLCHTNLRPQHTVPSTETYEPFISHSGTCKDDAIINKTSKKILSSLLINQISDYQRESQASSNLSLDSYSELPEMSASSTLPTNLSSCSTSSTVDKYSTKFATELYETETDHTVKNTEEKAVSRPKSAGSSQKGSRSRRLRCSACDLIFFYGTDLLVHRYEQHSHVCKECDGRFLSAARLKQHKETDHPSMVTCSFCRFCTFNKDVLQMHIWSQHGVKQNVALESEKQREHEDSCNLTEGKAQPVKLEPRLKFGCDVSKSSDNGTHSGIKNTNTSEVCLTEKLTKKTPGLLNVVESESSHVNTSVYAGRANLGNIKNKSGKAQKRSRILTSETFNDPKYESQGLKSELKLSLETCITKNLLENESSNTSLLYQQPCQTPVFPSFSRQVLDAGHRDLDSITAMYAQVNQHLNASKSSTMSEQPVSENEEPPLVIDTDFGCHQPEEKDVEGGSEERKENCTGTDSLQPLCLVTHNRTQSHSSTTTNYDTSRERSNRRSKLSLRQKFIHHAEHLTDITSEVTSKTESNMENNLSEGNVHRSCNSAAGISRGQDTFLNVSSCNAMDLSVDKTEREKSKLVMRFSRKRSTTCEVACGGQIPKLKRRRRRRGRGKTRGSISDNPVVEIDNPEELTDGDGSYYISNSSLGATEADNCPFTNAQCDLVLSRGDNLDAQDTRSSTARLCDRKDDKKSCGGQQTDRISLDSVQACGGQPGPEDDIHMMSHRLRHQTATSHARDKMPSLRDRHVMSSLPPKKRSFRRSPRANRDSERDFVPCSSAEKSVISHIRGDSVGSDEVFNTSDPAENFCAVTGGRRNPCRQISYPLPTRSGRLRSIRSRPGDDGTDKSRSGDTSSIVSSSEDRSRSNSDPPGISIDMALSGAESGCITDPADSRYSCPITCCNASFSRKWNLDGHISRVHTKHTFLSCTTSGCDMKFPSRKELRQHITVDHKGKVRKYKCSWPDCNKGFFARTHLRIHTLTHTGEKPVACQVCDYRCRQRTALVWHMRKHGVYHKTGKRSSESTDE